MERLTEWYDNGLREGVLVKEKRGEKEIKVLFEEVDDGYHAMCTLKAYEDTGLTPEQIREMKERDTVKAPEPAPLGMEGMVCPTCGCKAVPWVKFCDECGQKFVED